MKNGTAFKVLAWIFLGIGALTGFILLLTMSEGFNAGLGFLLFVICLVSGCVLFFTFFSVGAMMENIYVIRTTVEQQALLLRPMASNPAPYYAPGTPTYPNS